MDTWYNFLKESVGQQELDNFTDIFYLGSCPYSTCCQFTNLSNNLNIYDLLKDCVVDNTKDSLEFFLFVNKINSIKKVIIIYNPFELFDSSYVYKVIDFLDNKKIQHLPNYKKIFSRCV